MIPSKFSSLPIPCRACSPSMKKKLLSLVQLAIGFGILAYIFFSLKQKGAEVEVAELVACKGDQTQVNQVFTNLLDNAMKYLDPARPGIVRVRSEKRDGESVYCVEDNGMGIAPSGRRRTRA